jgi:hypothetical protein
LIEKYFFTVTCEELTPVEFLTVNLINKTGLWLSRALDGMLWLAGVAGRFNLD